MKYTITEFDSHTNLSKHLESRTLFPKILSNKKEQARKFYAIELDYSSLHIIGIAATNISITPKAEIAPPSRFAVIGFDSSVFRVETTNNTEYLEIKKFELNGLFVDFKIMGNNILVIHETGATMLTEKFQKKWSTPTDIVNTWHISGDNILIKEIDSNRTISISLENGSTTLLSAD